MAQPGGKKIVNLSPEAKAAVETRKLEGGWDGRILSAGGGSDVFLREMVPHLASIMGVKFAVENISGGSGARAMAALASAKPDGGMFYATTPTYIQTTLLSKPAVGYDQLDPMVIVFFDPTIIYTRTESPHKTFADVVADAKKNVGKQKWGAANPASLERIGSDIRVSFAYQDEPRGLGHAVWCARDAVGDEPFAVMLPDELMGDSRLLNQMADLCEASSGSVVGLLQVPPAEVSAYGVITPASDRSADGVVRIGGMVEKPAQYEAPSDLIIIGRYVLTPDVFGILEHLPPGRGGEIQLTDALQVQAAAGVFHGVLGSTRRYDTGNPLGWLTAVVDLALDDPAIGAEFRAWLNARG